MNEQIEYRDGKPFYTGPLNPNSNGTMTARAKVAYERWRGFRRRINNPNHKGYKHYGKKGIEVRVGSREFIGWFLVESTGMTKFKGIDVGRIDHDGHYEIGNIKLESTSDNTRERNARRGLPKTLGYVILVVRENGDPVRFFKNTHAVAKWLNITTVAAGKRLRRGSIIKPYGIKLTKF